MGGDVLFPYGRKSAGQVVVDTLWEAARSMGILDSATVWWRKVESLRGPSEIAQDLGIGQPDTAE